MDEIKVGDVVEYIKPTPPDCTGALGTAIKLTKYDYVEVRWWPGFSPGWLADRYSGEHKTTVRKVATPEP